MKRLLASLAGLGQNAWHDPRRGRRPAVPLAAALGTALLASSLVALPAHAATEWETTTTSTDRTDWTCGYPLAVRGELTESEKTTVDPESGLELSTVKIDLSEIWRKSKGAFVTVTNHSVESDLDPEPLGGSRYLRSTQVAGEPLTVTDAKGKVLSKDSGTITYRWEYDTETGEFVGLEPVVVGPHPSLDTELCAIIAPRLGTDSAKRLKARPIGSTRAGMGYYEYLPPSYARLGKPAPLLIATNGYGENGDGSAEELGRLLVTSIPRFINVGGWPASRPFVVLAPQHHEKPPGVDASSCDGGEWFGSCGMYILNEVGSPPESFCTTPDELHAFIDYALERYNVDRIYLTGLSCGAFGIWEYLGKYRNKQGVEAAVPISGDGRPALDDYGCALATVPIWAFHGETDDVVNPAGSKAPIDTLRAKCRGTSKATHRVQITNYGHEGWDAVYSGELGFDIYNWMLSRR